MVSTMSSGQGLERFRAKILGRFFAVSWLSLLACQELSEVGPRGSSKTPTQGSAGFGRVPEKVPGMFQQVPGRFWRCAREGSGESSGAGSGRIRKVCLGF